MDVLDSARASAGIKHCMISNFQCSLHFVPNPLSGNFPFTSISVNVNYAAARHRDRNNVGPSAIKAFGRYRGGQLLYWPKDERCGDVKDLPRQELASQSSGYGRLAGHMLSPVGIVIEDVAVFEPWPKCWSRPVRPPWVAEGQSNRLRTVELGKRFRLFRSHA